MPSHLRIFFWLVAAVTAYWALATLWYLEFPPAAITALLAKLPPLTRVMIEQNQWKLALVPIAVRIVIFLGLAWLAAFKRQNWARLGVLVFFVVLQLAPLVFSAAAKQLGSYLRSAYSDPLGDLSLLILAVAIVFSFTGNARAAFAAAE